MKFITKNWWALCCVLFFMESIKAQNNNIDSLKTELLLHTANDTTRVNLFNDLAYALYKQNTDKALAYLDEAETIAKTLNFKKGLSESLLIKGNAHRIRSRFDEGYQYLNEALQLCKEIRFIEGVSECYTALGMLFYDQEDHRRAIEYHQKSMEINQELGDKATTSANLGNIGKAYIELGNYTETISYFKKALEIDKEINDEKQIAKNLGNIAVVYGFQGNYPMAMEYHNESLALEEKHGDTMGIAVTINNKGIIYQNMRNYDQAITHYEKALHMQKKYGDKKTTADILINLGVVYSKKKDYKAAHNYLKEVLEICKEINYESGEAFALNNMGNVFLGQGKLKQALQNFDRAKTINLSIDNNLGLCASFIGLARVYANQKRNDKALANALKSKEISSKYGMIDYQVEANGLLSDIYRNMGDFRNAFISHEQFKILSDSLFNKENVEKITQLAYDYKYKQALDSASIRELKLSKTVLTTSQDLAASKQKYLWAIIGFLLVSILLGFTFFSQKYKNIKAKNQIILTEQKLLRSQMTPHFMFNSLSVLQGMILNKEESKSISYLSKFSKLLRTTLENSRHKMVPLSEELSAIDSYIALQNMDASPPFDYRPDIDPGLAGVNLKIPPMLVQPFVENSVEHAFDVRDKEKKIDVQITFKDKKLTCTIADNGRGIQKDRPKIKKNKNSLATTITSERLEILAKEFGMPSSVNIQNRAIFGEQGTLVTLVIPYKIEAISA